MKLRYLWKVGRLAVLFTVLLFIMQNSRGLVTVVSRR